jgi:hypothetical protein
MLGSATLALAGALSFAAANAQTPYSMPQQSPAAQTPATPTQDATTGTANKATTAHHRRHRVHTASNESRQERETTKKLNEQQLAQATSQQSQVAQAQAAALSQQTQQSATASGQTEASGDASNANAADAAMANATPQSSPMKTAQADQGTPDSSPQQAEPLTQVQNAQQTLASAQVRNAGGKTIGTVSNIQKDPSGTPTKVEVKLDQSLGMGNRSVWIDADQLKYEPQDNALTTNLSPAQLNTM